MENTNQLVTNQSEMTIPECSCNICYEINEQMITTRCNHLFCNDCLTTWTQNNNTCPMCRQESPIGIQESPIGIQEEEYQTIISEIIDINLVRNLLFEFEEILLDNNNLNYYENINNQNINIFMNNLYFENNENNVNINNIINNFNFENNIFNINY